MDAIKSAVREFKPLIERGVVALEKLATDPEVEIQAGPPECPHCGTYDPTVGVQERSASGPLSEFVLVCECHSCGRTFYVLVESYDNHANSDSARERLEERKRIGAFDSSVEQIKRRAGNSDE